MSTSHQLDNPQFNDNRRYDYSDHPDTDRYEYPIIADMVKQNSRVIDLGCGNGALLALLKKEKHVVETGLEISESGVRISKEQGLNVQYGKIDERLPLEDNSFDYAICNVTIQMVMYPEVLLREMKRVAQYQIISFPNFAFWKNRIDLLFRGRMPRKMLFEYQWYSTGHIHQLSFKDFEQLVNEVKGLKIVERKLEGSRNLLKNILMKQYPNLFQMLGIYLLEKQ
ncbi:MAG: methionine biosynthesis protein MetW [Bacteroidota bacterium]|nr:methionine biosynthesis protein MetW [Bacteroidota bacterium]